MKIASKLASAATLAICSAALAAPAYAQTKPAEQQAPAAQQRKFSFTKGATKSLQALQVAATAGDATTFPAALAAAQAVAKNADDRYFIAQMQLTYASKTNDEAGKRAAVDAIVASGGAQPDELQRLYRAQADFALNAKDYDRALAAYGKVLQAQPNDTAVLNNMVLLHRQRKDHGQAIALVRQAIASNKASGQKVPEGLYKLGLQSALDAKMNNELVPLTREFLGAYPTTANWRLALDLYRQSVNADDETLLDTFRLMRRVKTLDRASEYMALADALARGRYYAEARDVVNEGISAGKFNAANPSASAVLKEVSPRISGDKAALTGLEGRARSDATGAFALKVADGYFGHGEYAKAAEYYRLAIQKGRIDAGLANTRLGMSLAQSGDRAGAEAAFKAVTGARAELASFWLLWLTQRA
jgi:tetratricopeptide (TPR) repeat protein